MIAYTKGHGKISLNLAGYYPCHNPEEVIVEMAYDPERDLANPTGSVFCAHGAGFVVPWNEVPDYMHVEGRLLKKTEEERMQSQPENGKTTTRITGSTQRRSTRS